MVTKNCKEYYNQNNHEIEILQKIVNVASGQYDPTNLLRHMTN